jgi:hypothetical protein
MTKKTKSILLFLSQVMFSGILLFFVFQTISLEALRSQIANFRLGPLFYSLLLIPMTIFIRAWRWYLILKTYNVSVTLKEATQLTWIGQSLNTFLPATLGEIARSYFLKDVSGIWHKAMTPTLVDKLVAVSSIFFLGAIASLFFGEIYFTLFSAFFLIVSLGVIFFIFHISKRKPIIHWKNFGSWFAISLVGWLVTYFIMFILCRPFIGTEVSIFYYFSIAPLITLARILPISLNGLGVQEWVIIYSLKHLGISEEISVISSLMFTVVLVFSPAIIGWIFLLFRGYYSFSKTQKT